MSRTIPLLLIAAILLLTSCNEKEPQQPQVLNVPPLNESPMGESTTIYERREYLVERPDYKRVLAYFWLEPYAPFPENVKFPLVLILHGSTGNAYAGQYIATDAMRLQYPSFVLVPAAPKDMAWAMSDKAYANQEDLADVMTLLQDIITHYPVDPARIYVIGCSMGGWGSFGAVARYPDTFAAAIPISGGWDPVDAPKMIGTKILIFHGENDENVSVQLSRDMADALQSVGAPAQYKEIANMGHECPSPLLYGPEVWKWLFSQSK